MRGDRVRAAASGKADGVQVTPEVWRGMFHAFQAYEPRLPEGRRAIEHTANSVPSHVVT